MFDILDNGQLRESLARVVFILDRKRKVKVTVFFKKK